MYTIAILFPTSSPPLVLEENVAHLTERQGTFFMLILGEGREGCQLWCCHCDMLLLLLLCHCFNWLWTPTPLHIIHM
jgi:hypothetical protein